MEETSPSFDFAEDDDSKIVFVFFFAGAHDRWSTKTLAFEFFFCFYGRG